MAVEGPSGGRMRALATTSSPTTASPLRQVGGNSKLDKNAFLKLLMAQLKYQDPSKPMDNQQFVAQLAQFSQLEQMTALSEEMRKFNSLQALAQGAELLGKKVGWNNAEGGIQWGVAQEARLKDGDIVLSLADGREVKVSEVVAVQRVG